MAPTLLSMWATSRMLMSFVCCCLGSLVAEMVRNLPAMQTTRVWSLGQEDPLERKWQPTPVFLPGKFHGQRSLVSLSHVWLFCDPMDCSPPGSSVHGISQARILEWIATSFSRGSSQPKDQTCISPISRQILYHWDTGEAHLSFIHQSPKFLECHVSLVDF